METEALVREENTNNVVSLKPGEEGLFKKGRSDQLGHFGRSIKVRTEITFAFGNKEVIDLSKNGYGIVLKVEVRLEQKVRN